jgi:hypothetical protein
VTSKVSPIALPESAGMKKPLLTYFAARPLKTVNGVQCCLQDIPSLYKKVLEVVIQAVKFELKKT